MTTTLAEVHAWSQTTPVTVACRSCGAVVVVGVDAHDAGTDELGGELFACERCCDECGEAS